MYHQKTQPQYKSKLVKDPVSGNYWVARSELDEHLIKEGRTAEAKTAVRHGSLIRNPKTQEYWIAYTTYDAFQIQAGTPENAESAIRYGHDIHGSQRGNAPLMEPRDAANCMDETTGYHYNVDNPDDAYLVSIGKVGSAPSAKFVCTDTGSTVKPVSRRYYYHY